MATYYTELQYMGRLFRISLLDLGHDVWHPEVEVFTDKWELDPRLEVYEPERTASELYTQDVLLDILGKVQKAVITVRPSFRGFLVPLTMKGVYGPSYSDFAVAKLQVEDAIRRLRGRKRWGFLIWDGKWHRG